MTEKILRKHRHVIFAQVLVECVNAFSSLKKEREASIRAVCKTFFTRHGEYRTYFSTLESKS